MEINLLCVLFCFVFCLSSKLSDVTSQALGAIGQIYAQIGHFLKAIEL